MLDYQTFCYLQNQKTGCTFVEQFLMTFSKEPLRRYQKHRAPNAKEAGKFYFVNVREPIDNYLSLFNYGLDGKGEVHQRLLKAGHADLYDVLRPEKDPNAFDEWLMWMLDPDFSGTLYREYSPSLAQVGFVSMRFLRLACFGFTYPSPVVDHVLKMETLRHDLAILLNQHLAPVVYNFPAALDWVLHSPPVNTSVRRERTSQFKLKRRTIKSLLQRERVLYDVYYPEVKQMLGAIVRGEVSTFRDLIIVDDE